MSENITIALDCMGGDHGVTTTVPAALRALKSFSDLSLVLVGDEDKIRPQCAGSDHARVKIHHATQVVEMDEPPSKALRTKKDSSMRVAIDLVKQGEADACVSAGNTGALMATGRFVLKMIPGIDRPAICTAIPTISGHTHMLDLGANVDSYAEHLFQFALMGSTLATAIDGNEEPRIGLLNIGEEEIKGNERVKEAGRLLAQSDLNYAGFIEGTDIYAGDIDVVVCDGFVGNISLKTSEGVAKMISYFMKKEFNRNIFTKLAGLIALPVLNAFKRKIDPRLYNGASLLGLQGIVIKSHGSADEIAFANAIKIARLAVENKVIEKTQHLIEELASEGQIS